MAAGKTYEHGGQLIHDLQALKDQKLDVSHTIASLTFGEETYPGQNNPLSGASFDQKQEKSNSANFPGLACCPSALRDVSGTACINRTTAFAHLTNMLGALQSV